MLEQSLKTTLFPPIALFEQLRKTADWRRIGDNVIRIAGLTIAVAKMVDHLHRKVDVFSDRISVIATDFQHR